jgi:hypothetical protein
MRAEAAAMGADGIVGVKLTIKRLEWDDKLLEFIAIGTGVVHGGNHAWQSHVIEFFAIGTAVLPLEREIAPEKIADPIMVLSVND